MNKYLIENRSTNKGESFYIVKHTMTGTKNSPEGENYPKTLTQET